MFRVDALGKSSLGGVFVGAEVGVGPAVEAAVFHAGEVVGDEVVADKDAGTYLTKLAEHPSTNMQLLVTTLLDRHVTDVEKLRALAPFLATVSLATNVSSLVAQAVVRRVIDRVPAPTWS